MTDIETARLRLHPIDESEGTRIVARTAGPKDRWAVDYPFSGDLAAVGAFLHATKLHNEQSPFGYYQIIRADDRLAVGGVGFKGAPEDGRVEVGYGLAPSARGQAYAAEALMALLAVAARHGVDTVLADTTEDNIPSQRTLDRAGFSLVGADAELQHYEIRCAGATSAPDPHRMSGDGRGRG